MEEVVQIRVNFSLQTFEYFKDYNLGEVADYLLSTLEYLSLPDYGGKRDVVRDVTVTNQEYIHLRNTLGSKSHKLSLSRLFEYAYNIDILASPLFSPRPQVMRSNQSLAQALRRAYNALDAAVKYLNGSPYEHYEQIIKGLRQTTGTIEREVRGGVNEDTEK